MLSAKRVLALLAASSASVHAAVDTYEFPIPRPTPGYVYEGWAAYDPTQPVTIPALPNPMPSLDFNVALDYSGSPKAGIAVNGSFLGVSIEMSLSEMLIGPNASWVRPQFLNLMSTLKERGGSPVVRVGGNSQEKAYYVDSLPGGASTQREQDGVKTVTNTPTFIFTDGFIRAMRQVSDLLGVQWFLGMPFNQSDPARLEIVEVAEPILGDYLLTLHLGNEPDLYGLHGYRNETTWSEAEYITEFGSVITQMQADPNISSVNKLGGPAVCECNTGWSNDDLIANHNYLGLYGQYLNALIVMHYLTDNCPDLNGTRVSGEALTAKTQNLFEQYATHNGGFSAVHFASLYTSMAGYAASSSKPLVLLETNTASCNGYLGLSDSFLASLWHLDLAMQLAASGWSHMMIHIGGQAAWYNPFMSPPHNASAPFMWTVGPPFYANLVVAELLGQTGTARVADLGINANNTYMGGYVVYENNQPVRVLLINFMSDTGGSADYTARIQVSGSPDSVSVRYLVANNITSKSGFYYANQTFGTYFESDGLLRGEQVTETAACTSGSCAISVPAPGAAVVFLNGDLVFDASKQEVQTFATSHTTSMHNTAAVDGLTLATSNGMNAKDRAAMKDYSTSQGKSSSDATPAPSPSSKALGVLVACAAVLFGVVTVF